MSEFSSVGHAKRGRKSNHQVVAPLSVTPAPPLHLSSRAQDEWNRIVPAAMAIGTFTHADLRAMELLCDALATIAELSDAVRDEGYTLPTADGGRKGNPLLRAISEQRSHAMKLLASFGLTPLGRMSVDVKPERSQDNPFLALMLKSSRGDS
ncbi:MAG TPA: phage terminase small subunit P27 family [Noviherbaspirillum sp.]|uniref:phage terminase small subunit P27 family n=1 Tax=Noviherbaspirillum sp. TaxID=1926288 RepID=UPI002B47B932|nr:phage terminase small subunit P27 family [Noviherbaspirillum sp.]HJV88379.1 phage terminase small subunit P27 family [Noviherbaspirillum sp.]